jgi:hypothetical protein
LRAYFEHIFGKPFPRVRERTVRRELDGYNSDLRLAFEHHGAQHYRLSQFTKTEEELRKIRSADRKKKALCEKHGIRLLIVSELETITELAKLPSLIYRFARENRIPTKVSQREFHLKNVRFENLYGKETAKERLSELRRFAQQNSLKFLSTSYAGTEAQYEWECSKGHRFKRSYYYAVKMGRGRCPVCLGRKHVA